jgi:hypothetical protein
MTWYKVLSRHWTGRAEEYQGQSQSVPATRFEPVISRIIMNFNHTNTALAYSMSCSVSERCHSGLFHALWATREKGKRWIYAYNGPIGLWNFEAPTYSRESSHRLRWGCQSYPPASKISDSRVRSWVDTQGHSAFGRIRSTEKNPIMLSGIEPGISRLVGQCTRYRLPL